MHGLSLSGSSNDLWLEFYSDQEATAPGFRLSYRSESPKEGAPGASRRRSHSPF
ncbi:CUB and sushi domain-containing protein 3 [Liparis tanakae]|uniref:CUB and sushi domain-containing protein 3 n=1 Tax=Liparis tanakae TaxID=230148 RepID=A0A4Z2E1P6_9TELE|nr:CUB and sushi domain-containing protein 3 [Liparis tanakae]